MELAKLIITSLGFIGYLWEAALPCHNVLTRKHRQSCALRHPAPDSFSMIGF